VSGLAGIVSKISCDNSRDKTNMLLEKISHRGGQSRLYNISGGCIGINTNYDQDERSGGNTVLLDGRVYNLDDIIKKYKVKIKDAEVTDAQKISLLFNSAGEGIFREFKGSFAMIIVDGRENIYILRDVIGKKPFYYHTGNNTIMFASEVKSLIGSTNDILEFPPGAYMKNFGEPEIIKQIETENYPILEDMDLDTLEKILKSHLLKSMESRIPDRNMDLGVWLSGGLDSSIVAALLKEFTDKIKTYSVGYENSPDLLAAREVAKYLGTSHTEYKLDTDELFKNIPKAIYYLESYDAPLVRSTLGNMIASKLSSSSDMVFSGEGGDELFAGYNYFLEYDCPGIIQQELVNAINSLHNTALQRVDRVANAYRVNVRLPLLDENLLDYVLKIPVDEKIKKDKNMSKYILRKVASDYLPDEIAWRAKDKFWEGSGIEDTIEKKVDSIISDEEFSEKAVSSDSPYLRSKEEVYYYNIFNDFYSDVNVNNILSFTRDFNSD
jgi:asparagine synthase (glutamine-hydrolysing)